MPREWDGVVSRHVNRKFSRPIARFLARYPRITPNKISVLSFLVALASGAAFYLRCPPLGGLLSQFSSILDGVDGDLAEITSKASPFGGFLDAVLDRYGDAAILTGMVCSLVAVGQGEVLAIAVGLAALFGSLIVSYTRARAKSDLRLSFDRGFAGYAANRDVRLFIIMIGGLLDQVLVTLVVIAVLTNLNVLARIWAAWRAVESPPALR